MLPLSLFTILIMRFFLWTRLRASSAAIQDRLILPAHVLFRELCIFSHGILLLLFTFDPFIDLGAWRLMPLPKTPDIIA